MTTTPGQPTRRRTQRGPGSASASSIRIEPTRSSTSRRPSIAGSATTSSSGSTSRDRWTPGSTTRSRRGWSSGPRRGERSARGTEPARIALHGGYFHVRVATEADHEPSESPHWLDLVAAGNVVLTRHAEPVAFLRELDERVEADTNVGAIDAPAFVATAIDSAITSYFKSVDEIEDAVERLDRRALLGRPGDDVLSDLVALRRRIGRLRRVLSDEREVFAAFRAADFAAVVPDGDTAAFLALADRFESALRNVEQSRDLLIGSFDIFMTRTAQRTNEVMKVLALATVLLLPGSLIAGLLGMNMPIPLSDENLTSFWLVLAVIILLALAVLVFARVRRWI